MIDLSGGFSVQTAQDDRTGKWFVQCPACPQIIKAMTESGLDTSLCVHMNERHFMPRRGNS